MVIVVSAFCDVASGLAGGVVGKGPVAAWCTDAVSSVVVISSVVAIPVTLPIPYPAEHTISIRTTVPQVKQTLFRVADIVTYPVPQLRDCTGGSAIPTVELVI